jgi:methyl-accepting chemotaxis protein
MTFEQLQSLLEQTVIGLAETNKALNRVEMIAESNARAIQATANKLDEKFDLIGDAVLKNQEMIMKLDRRYRKQQAEIKGLRVETRRILERWLGEPFPEDPDLDDEPE